MVARGDADAMLCGVEGRFLTHLRISATSSVMRPGVECSPRCRW